MTLPPHGSSVPAALDGSALCCLWPRIRLPCVPAVTWKFLLPGNKHSPCVTAEIHGGSILSAFNLAFLRQLTEGSRGLCCSEMLKLVSEGEVRPLLDLLGQDSQNKL